MKKIALILSVISLVFLASCGGNAKSLDIINPDAEYRYFYGATCPHCQELNRIAESRDLYSQISIEKREVYGSEENRQIFLDLIDEIGAQSSGVPFVYDTVSGEYAVGVRPALELMTSRLGQNTSNNDSRENPLEGETSDSNTDETPNDTQTNTGETILQ